MPQTSRCDFCGKGPFPTHAGLSKHIQRASACREASKKELGQYIANIWQDYEPHMSDQCSHTQPSFHDDPSTEHLDPTILDAEINAAGDFMPAFTPIQPIVEDLEVPGHRNPLLSVPDNFFSVETYPAEAKAGATWGTGTPKFQAIHKEQAAVGKEWGPFEDENEWQLAEWLIKNVGQTQTDKFLKLKIIVRLLLYTYLSQADYNM